MFCPKCGQERTSIETNYCSRCGFLLTGTTELLSTGGVIPQLSTPKGFKAMSPRNRGLKQGLFIFLLTFLIVPLIAIATVFIDAEPVAVAVAAILLTVGGLLRMAYAMLFESTGSTDFHHAGAGLATPQQYLHPSADVRNLPPPQSVPATAYATPSAGSWRDTNNLQPTSVTEVTTRLLEKDELDQ